ncbi:MAG: sugar ABC transporter ATP-binding protein [Anaerolineae bacterium]|nr:sugar ABC transporter ATP-binding protein [Anaerolineae bacterium]
MAGSPVLQLQHISKQFANIQALDNVDFDLYEGETHALVGENGAGKSTLMRILSGVYTEFDGAYLLDGQPVRLQSPHDALSRGIAMIHQELSVMPELSVAENLFLGRQLANRLGLMDWKRMYAIAEEELARLGFDYLDVRRPLGNYPLGTQQVVEVLRTIISGARVIIMDEPTSALSPAEVDRLIGLIDKLRQDKRSIIYISHFLEEVMKVADRVTVLRDGARVATLNASDTSVHHLISLILGREVNATLPPALHAADEGQTLLEVKDLSADVFHNISFKVNRGEVLGIYGAIGAGHFDLARALFGMYRYDSGAISLDGETFKARHSARYAIQHGLAYAIEARRKSLLMDEPIYRNITLPHLYRTGQLAPSAAHETRIALPAIQMVNVHPPDPLNPVGKLSGGNQQKVAIARWLTYPPKVFVMSEPTRGMDVGAKSEVLAILRKFRNDGYGVLVVSSEPETILTVSDRVIVMSRGNIVAHLENKDLDKDVLMRLL